MLKSIYFTLILCAFGFSSAFASQDPEKKSCNAKEQIEEETADSSQEKEVSSSQGETDSEEVSIAK